MAAVPRREWLIPAVLMTLLLALSGPSQAQDPLALEPDGANAPALGWFSDLLLRGDFARDLPLGLPDEQRGLARLRAGLRWMPDDAWELGAALEASHGADSIKVIRIAHDNQRTDDLGIDLLYARWQPGEQTRIVVGKQVLPLDLSPMLWDVELRPVGLSLEQGIPVGDFDRLVLSGGAWLGDHLYGDTSRIVAAQAGWRLREGAPTSGAIVLSLLDFDHLDEIVRSGLVRSNRRSGNTTLSDFRLLDLQLAFDTQLAGRPLRTRLDLVRNLGADDQRDGARGSVVWGDARQAREWELGLAYQRVQRDAVLTAFNSEDWWFHSAMRGAMPWIGYGIDDNWRMQLALFLERADGRAVDTERALLDLRAQW
jgi:hypothetical protein